MPDSSSVQVALRVAIRHADETTTTETEREAILAAVANSFSGHTGETAAISLFHLREQRRTQLVLKNILEEGKSK